VDPEASRPDRAAAPALLRRDVRRLTSALGAVLHEESPPLLDTVERVRRSAIALRRRRGHSAAVMQARMSALVEGLRSDQAERVARAFTVYFQLVNLAEERHRARTLGRRQGSRGAIPDSLATTVQMLRSGPAAAELAQLLARLDVHPVLTAHPTEARRRAVIDTLARIAQAMDRLDAPVTAGGDRADSERGLLEQVAILWRTAQLRRTRPTPGDEVRTVMTVFDDTLFLLAPRLYRELDRALIGPQRSGVDPPAARAFLRWGSWVGADRDGNPAVTSQVTRAAAQVHADHALRALEGSARRIGRSLTVSAASTPPSAALLAGLARDAGAYPRAATSIRTRAPDEPHRQRLLLVAERLAATRREQAHAYADADQLLRDLRELQASLVSAGAARLAYGELQDLVWQTETFGFTFAELEVRQHAEVHRDVCRELYPGSEADADLLDRLARDGWPAPMAAGSSRARELVATLRVIADLQGRWGPGVCRRYVVSFTHGAADVLAVRALARLAVPDRPLQLDVVPLFESRHDLDGAPRVLQQLLHQPGWREWLERGGRRLEVMLGYSDSAKDVGVLAANLALHRAQAALTRWARGERITLTLFHGRGGPVGRGGGPAGRAISGQAAGSVDGRFKVTEQGEVIFARYAHPAIALRHLEQVTSAILTASTTAREAALRDEAARFQDEADLMAQVSEGAYLELVGQPGFAEFFTAVSPLDEIGRLHLGSRPARRGRAPGLAGLRAIPWAFAWAQTRCNLPGWFGVGSGLEAVAQRHGPDRLAAMNRDWPFFSTLLENVEMSLAKADPMIAGLYLELGHQEGFVTRIREEYRRARRQLLQATGHRHLLAGRPVLGRAVALRNPYVDALSFLQLRFLRELRACPPGDSDRAARLLERVLLTVNGVAAGLQNTG